MQHLDQQHPHQTIIGHHCHQVVHRCDQWAGCNGRVYFDLMEKHRYHGSYHAGEHPGLHQGIANSAGDQERMGSWIAF